MTIEDLKLQKAILESDVQRLLKEFQDKTGILIKSIYVETAVVKCGEIILAVKTELTL